MDARDPLGASRRHSTYSADIRRQPDNVHVKKTDRIFLQLHDHERLEFHKEHRVLPSG